jgi:hypothetical protein
MAKKIKKAASKVKRKAPVAKVGTWIQVEEEIIIAGGGLLIIVMIVAFLF